ncbi:hypothetical protein pb186bvf_014794 [Paramecium bursaria]
MSNRGRVSSRSPDKGAFPLDHFHECDKQANDYTHCITKHELMPKRCRKFQVEYLTCRMNNGLMQKEDLEKLGITQETSWESEEQEKQFLYDKIERMREKAMQSALRRFTQQQEQNKQEEQKQE